MADDLLQPTLEARDDATGFDDPWHPWRLVFATFFIGPLAGGWLFASNYRHLGLDRRVAPTLWGACALTTLLTVYGVTQLGGLEATREQGRLLRTIVRVVSAVAAAGVAADQGRRYRVFQMHGGEARSVYKSATVALLVSIPIYAILFLLVDVVVE